MWQTGKELQMIKHRLGTLARGQTPCRIVLAITLMFYFVGATPVALFQISRNRLAYAICLPLVL